MNDELNQDELSSQRREILETLGSERGTPCYVYFVDSVLAAIEHVKSAFEGRFSVSFAVKSNPNVELLKYLRGRVATLDISSIGELRRGLKAGFPGHEMTFSGPAKREPELREAVEKDCGTLVCESEEEIQALEEIAEAAGKRVSFVIRINPRKVPAGFGVAMAGKASQFGIDEEDLDDVLGRLGQWSNLQLEGFHVYSGTNCLKAESISENFSIFIELFRRFSEQYQLTPGKLIFGAGFGIPYHSGQAPLSLSGLAELINPQIDALREQPNLRSAECHLELGRFVVGPHGYFLTKIVREKSSRGVDIVLCDGGFNNHLAAFGMMGTIIRRNWQIWKVSTGPEDLSRPYTICGPLCTTIDVLATDIELPLLAPGDLIAVGSSGAYGFTSSPTRFISHPEPREYLVVDRDTEREIIEVTEEVRPDLLNSD